MVEFEAHRHAQALVHYERAAALHSLYAEPHCNMGVVFKLQGDNQCAPLLLLLLLPVTCDDGGELRSVDCGRWGSCAFRPRYVLHLLLASRRTPGAVATAVAVARFLSSAVAAPAPTLGLTSTCNESAS